MVDAEEPTRPRAAAPHLDLHLRRQSDLLMAETRKLQTRIKEDDIMTYLHYTFSLLNDVIY